MGEDEKEATLEVEPWQLWPQPRDPVSQKSRDECKHQAMGGTSMKGIPVPLKKNAEDNIHVG